MNESIVKIMEVIVMKYEDMSLEELDTIINSSEFNELYSDEEAIKIIQTAIHKKISKYPELKARPLIEVFNPDDYSPYEEMMKDDQND